MTQAAPNKTPLRGWLAFTVGWLVVFPLVMLSLPESGNEGPQMLLSPILHGLSLAVCVIAWVGYLPVALPFYRLLNRRAERRTPEVPVSRPWIPASILGGLGAALVSMPAYGLVDFVFHNLFSPSTSTTVVDLYARGLPMLCVSLLAAVISGVWVQPRVAQNR